MQFESINDFIAMGGYAFYVWTGVGLVVGMIAGLIYWTKKERTATFEAINEQLRIAKLRKQQRNSEMSL